MKKQPQKINIVCRFCGVVTGSRKFSGETSEAEIAEKMAEVVDSRCDLHHTEHGDYSEMSKYFTRHIGTSAQFKDVIFRSDYRIAGFLKTMVDEFPDKVEEAHVVSEIGISDKNRSFFDGEMKRLRKIKPPKGPKQGTGI